MKQSWFEEWFNSPYYHILYDKRDEREADYFITNLCAHLQLPAGARVWDIACGKGRHTLAFARKGFRASGTDLSENSISEALKQSSGNPEFFVHDMRRIFRVNYFDCAVNLFTSIGYFDRLSDNLSVFQNVHAALKKDGHFVIDFFNAEKVKAGFQPEYSERRGDIEFRISKEITNRIICKTIRFEAGGKEHEFRESVSLLELHDFEGWAKHTGFSISGIFGDYALRPFNKLESERLILIFKK